MSKIKSFGQEEEEKDFSQRRMVVEPIVRVTEDPDTEDEVEVEEVIAAAAAVEDAPGEPGGVDMVKVKIGVENTRGRERNAEVSEGRKASGRESEREKLEQGDLGDRAHNL